MTTWGQQGLTDSNGTCVLGVDGTKTGWVGVVLVDGKFAQASLAPTVRELAAAYPQATVIAVDIPIGLPEQGSRAADLEARKFLGRGSSVFPTLPRAVLEAPTYAEASAIARQLTGKGITQQSYALRGRILEVDSLAAEDARVIEVHPEVSFRALAGKPLKSSKKTWNGLRERMEVLGRVGIELPEDLGLAGQAGPDDVLDAAVAGWTAVRFAAGLAKTLPEATFDLETGRRTAIWY